MDLQDKKDCNNIKKNYEKRVCQAKNDKIANNLSKASNLSHTTWRVINKERGSLVSEHVDCGSLCNGVVNLSNDGIAISNGFNWYFQRASKDLLEEKNILNGNKVIDHSISNVVACTDFSLDEVTEKEVDRGIRY